MKFRELEIQGVYIIEPEPVTDARGLFRRHFCARELAERNLVTDVRQCNVSENPKRHTLRGFHYQIAPHGERKIISCFKGAIYDVVVDVRGDTATYLRWLAVELSDENRLSLYVPCGCANAFMTLRDDTWIFYYHSQWYTPEAERGIRYNDPLFQVDWPAAPVVISAKDQSHPDFTP